MVTQYFEIGNNDWGVILCYNYNFLDSDDIWAICRAFGLSEHKTKDAVRILMCLNTGMTISNQDLRMSVVFVGDAVSESEWWSTCQHELWHVTTAIIDYYGEAYYAEPAAYLHGEITRLVVEGIAPPCH